MSLLVRDGEVLSEVEVAATRAARRRGLLGRDAVQGALLLQPCRQVHSFGMRFAIDVVWCDARGQVLRATTLPPGRVSRLVLRARFVLEAAAGTAHAWRLRPGDVLEVAA